MAEIYGRQPVLEAIKAGSPINRILVAKGSRHADIDAIYQEAKLKKLLLTQVDRKILDGRFPGAKHQGVVAELAEVAYSPWQEMIASAQAKGEDPLIVVLDEVQDPHNLGAILRNADAFGAHGVIIPKRRSASLNATVAKTSAGADQHVPVDRVNNLADCLRDLKAEGLWVCGTDAGGDSLDRVPLTGPLALVIGSEGKGMRRIISENCDFNVAIPMYGAINSLNASVAAGVLLYEISRQRISS